MIKQKKREKIGKDLKNNYHIWSSGRLLSLILMGLSFLFFILSIIEIPFLSTIPGYTFGFLFGYYSFIFYLILMYYCTCRLFNINIYIIKMISKIRVFNYSWLNTFILIFGIVLIIETSIYMINNKSPFPGVEVWGKNFNVWWESFTSLGNALEPNISNPGIIITFILSILYSIGGTIVSIIFSAILILYFTFYLFFSSPIKKFENKKENKKKIEKENNEYETKIVDLSFEDDNKIVVSDFGTKIIENISEESEDNIRTKITKFEKKEVSQKTETSIQTIPFDNPFDEPETFISSEKLTQEIKNKKNENKNFEDTEFIFNNEENIDSEKKIVKDKIPSIYNQTSGIQVDKTGDSPKSKNKKKKKR